MSQTFQSHVSAVISLLNAASMMKQNSSWDLDLFTYVTAKSHQKMRRRFQHPRYSKHFFEGILGIPPSRASDIRRPFLPPHSKDTPWGKRDVALMESLASPTTEHFLVLSDLKIPNLLTLAKNYVVDSEPPSIYTSETCEEVQRLLSHLLRSYEAALLALDEFEGQPLRPEGIASFEMAIYCLAACGLTLRDLVYASFFEDHLLRMQLGDRRAQQPDAKVDDDDNGDDDGDDDGELDSDLISVQPHTILPGKDSLSICDSYADWLRLQVIYFEATNNLIGVSSKFLSPRFSASIFAIPFPKKISHAWQDVLPAIILFPLRDPDGTTEYTLKNALDVIESILPSGKLHSNGSVHCEALLAVLILLHRTHGKGELLI